MNRRTFLKAISCGIIFPSIAEFSTSVSKGSSKKSSRESSLDKFVLEIESRFKVALMDSNSKLIFDMKSLSLEDERMVAFWSIEKRCHIATICLYIDDKLIQQTFEDIEGDSGDTLRVFYPMKMCERIVEVANSGEIVEYVRR